MNEEQNAALNAEREAFAAMQKAQAVVTQKFAAVYNGTGSNPTEAELELAERTRMTWEQATARLRELARR